MIITCKKKIPMRWVAFAVMPWAAFTMKDRAITVAFLFSLKKFIENPAGLSFVMSLSSFIAIVVAPITSFTSDRIWTRYGRRKPFLIVAWLGMAASLMAMPFVPNLVLLIAAYFFFYFSQALNAPMEPLKQEIIPPAERGRATGLMTWFSNIATITFYFVMLGRFDDVTFMWGFTLTGEAVIYWSAGLFLLTVLVLIVLGIKEIDQHSPLRGEKISLRTIAGGLLDRELWPVYLLVVGFAFLNFHSGIGTLTNLLYTDQWGYTKQEMGVNVAIGGLINVFLIGILTLFADRLPRMRAYQTFIWLILIGNFLFYAYVEFVLPDKRPTLIEIIVFGELLSVISILTGVVYFPLIYDYVRRNKMGTFAAGEQIVRRLTVFFTANTVGIFVWVYAAFFQPPAGPMTRVVLREAATVQQVQASVQAAGEFSVRPWNADNSPADIGRAWEIRRGDKAGEKLSDERTALERERAKLSSDTAAAARNKPRLAEINARVATIDRALERDATALRDTVLQALGDQPMPDGAQILAAAHRGAVLAEIATPARLDGGNLELLAARLRRDNPAVIDLRPARRTSGYGLVVSAFPADGQDEEQLARTLFGALSDAAQAQLSAKESAAAGFSLVGWRRAEALELTLQVIETPVVTYVSPIMRGVNAVWGVFAEVPQPTRRLDAIARSLQTDRPQAHVRVTGATEEKTLSVVSLLAPAEAPPATPDDAIGRRLRVLLPAADHAALAAAQAFYARVETAAAAQRITVARPVLAHGYAPLRYDYMSGYLWMFLMSIIGISLTVVFKRLEDKGVVRKRGVEEAQAS